MAAEDELPQSLRDLNELLKTLNNTVETVSEKQTKHRLTLQSYAKSLEEFAKEVKAGTKTVKEYEEKKAAYEQDAVRRARSLAQEQLAAEKETRTFASRLSMAAGASVQNQKALLVWGNRLKATGDVLANIGGNVGKFASDLASGNTKFTALNPIIDGVTGALGKMAEAIPFAGSALSGAMKLAAEGAKFMLGQLQAATEAFQDISRVGASGAEGIEGIMRQFQQSGMTMQGFVKAIKENSSALAAFGGTAAKGADALSQISKNIIDSDAGDYLRRLGFTADEMGESTARYIAQQQRLGATQGKSIQQLAQGSAAYLRELDLLAKVTGQSREATQEALNAQLRESRYLSTLRIMERENRGKEAGELKKLTLATGAYNDELSAAIRDASSNIVDSDVVKQFMAAGIDILGAVDKIKTGGASAEQVYRDLQRQVGAVLPDQEQFAQYLDASNKTFPTLYKNVDFVNAGFDTALARGEQRGVQENKLTQNAADAQKSMEQMSRQMSALATSILPNFSTAISRVTDAMNQALQKMGVPGVVGSRTGGATPTGVASGAMRPTGGAGAIGGGAAGGAAAGGGAMRPTGGAGAIGGGAAGGAASLGQIREMVAGVESRGNYNVVVGGAQYPLTDMTVSEVLALQKQLISAGKDSAAGKYQIKYSTLVGIMGKAGIGLNDKFNQATQDKLADALIMNRGFAQYASNPTEESKARFLANLSKEWAGLPGGPSGESYYKGVGNNKAGIGWQQAMASFQTGGIASGPRSGYTALLHGNEAVVPLPDGKTIPVEMPNLDRSMEQQVNMMGAQLVALEELVRYMRENASISQKILQATHN